MKNLLLLIFLLPCLAEAQTLKLTELCGKYKKESVHHLTSGSITTAAYTVTLKDAGDFALEPVHEEAALQHLRERAACAEESFIKKQVRAKKLQKELRQNYTILEEKLYRTKDNLLVGVLKSVSGDTYKLYSNTLVLVDGVTIHSFTDRSEEDFNIALHGAEKTGDYYALYGREDENQGSLYFGKFVILSNTDEQVRFYEKHIEN
ncbi:hypothetical protein C8N40_10580 [Pontibacter mucosus]|uniref:Uncharacterized protein n=1 Tax=Pontibacter mucosus TaxID=1649266 RepID=A0A2T5YHL8_9BACT|nr:hypothetical protein [Pontibacter mucosus]PTX18791.1 hypothetical protein C8N40_10580 [Pontibacter mucosus]